jgi:RNA polymerase sigma factor (sigma-70 family)
VPRGRPIRLDDERAALAALWVPYALGVAAALRDRGVPRDSLAGHEARSAALYALCRAAALRDPAKNDHEWAGFLARVVRWQVRDELRRWRPRPVPPGGPRGARPSPLDSLVLAEEAGAVRDALASLTPAQRQAVVRRALEGRPWDEVAGERGVARQNAMRPYRRALRRLREMLGDDDRPAPGRA